MNRMIITPDGTRLIEEGYYRRLVTRTVIAALIFIALLITVAAVIGFTKAALADTNNQPSAANISQLHKAESAGGRNCRLEWNETQLDHEVICDPTMPTADYNDGWTDGLQGILDNPGKASSCLKVDEVEAFHTCLDS